MNESSITEIRALPDTVSNFHSDSNKPIQNYPQFEKVILRKHDF